MSELITVNDMKNAVTRALDNAFPEIPIYGDKINQNLDPPCFFVKLFPVGHKRLLGRRYDRQHTFDIHYFSEKGSEEINDVTEQLFGVMEYIDCNGLIRGTDMRGETVDGVLHFFVSYDFHVLRQRPKSEPMQFMDVKQELKLERSNQDGKFKSQGDSAAGS
ncbi:phage tail terminator family protein [Paenibacillus pinihumi]|uniref:phage tail terminator family protein n=1 Tax=Paenibacillus pinihumi TaxID=669462 RepID=UPI000A480BBA|nr:hypothetical protein [Paenibacillus pinihumi]